MQSKASPSRRQTAAHVNAIGRATPAHDFHDRYVSFMPAGLSGERERRLFARMASRAGIAARHSPLEPGGGAAALDTGGFYRAGAYPSTGARMARYEAEAAPLAERAVEDLADRLGPGWRAGITHLVLTTCTGFAAPGVDQHVIKRFGLSPSVERTTVGFMGCNAAFNALKIARHVVRSEPEARVLVLNLELCSLHLQETGDLETALMFLLFADGCAASLVSADATGLELDRFGQALLPESAGQITWRIGDDGFDMHLSGAVPRTIGTHLPAHVAELLGQRPLSEVGLWAVHPGGRSILDAVEECLDLGPEALAASRDVLASHGNMSSATVMFVLAALLERAAAPGERGVALGFGPGLSVESFTFRVAA